MRVGKVINNNVVSALDEGNAEIIVMGKGLGFGKKPGEEIDVNRIEKIFRMDSEKELEDFKDLVKRLPIEYLRLTDQIISYSKEIIGLELNQNVYLTLTDHISFAVERYQKGMNFPNALFEEIRMFYPKEYLVGTRALDLIRSSMNINLPEDEAASIALHLLNAEYHGSIGNALQMTTMISEIVGFINKEYDFIHLAVIRGGEEERAEISIQKNWMISNIKYLVHRLLKIEARELEVGIFKTVVEEYCVKEYALVKKIKEFLKEKYDCNMTEDEEIYLSIVIYRAEKLLKV